MALFDRLKRASRLTPARSVPFVQDPTGAPAVSLDKVPAVLLVKRAQKAGVSLSKRSLSRRHE